MNDPTSDKSSGRDSVPRGNQNTTSDIQAARWVVAVLAVVALLVVLAAIALPSVGSRRAPDRVQSMNNVASLSRAVIAYSTRKIELPPAYVADENGKPMTSWRALLLTEMGRGDLQEMYDYTQPWDSLKNRKVAEVAYELFQSARQRSRKTVDGLPITNYVAVVGDETLFPGEKTSRLDQIPDGPSYTLLFVEILDSDIAWAEPRDLTMDEFLERVRQGKNFKGPNRLGDPCIIAFADGSVRAIALADLTESNARALLTRAAGDEIKFP